MLRKILLIVVVLTSLVYAFDFYSGDSFLYSVDTEIDINGGASVVSYYVFRGSDKVDIDLVWVPDDAVVEFDGKVYSKEFSIDPDGEKQVKVSYSFVLGDGDLQSITYNPKPTFDGKMYSGKIKHNLKIVAPSYLNDFTSASKDYDSSYSEGGKNVFVWESFGYITSLILKWNTLDVDVSVVREIPDVFDEVFEVKVIVENNGGAVDLLLEDNFMVSHFEGVSPEEEFEVIVDESDTRLYWRKTISVAAGGREEVSYELRALNLEERSVFNPLVVKSGGIIVASTEEEVYFNDDIGLGKNIGLGDVGYPSEPSFPEIIYEEEGILVTEEIEKSEVGEKYVKVVDGVKKSFVYVILIVGVIILVLVLFMIFGGRSRKLKGYVRRQLKKGHTKESIRSSLLKSGRWKAGEVDKVLRRF